jgi:undecaprenyl diphosphate synthase
MQSTLPNLIHVAIIMDGNGRWAAQRGLPRPAGHRAGAAAVRRVVEAAPDLGIRTLTLFAFSSDNWRRPPGEVQALMLLLRQHLQTETPRLIENGTRLTVIGRRDRLPGSLRAEIARTELASAAGARLHLRLAIDYSARDAIVAAAADSGSAALSRESVARRLSRDGGNAGDVDLLIRSGGEKRLSDFLLWESAYAELRFVETLWPDFGAAELEAAVADFHSRERRFGGLAPVDPQMAAE